MKKAEKKMISYNETNIGGACMSGKYMSKKEESETASFLTKYKAGKRAKQPRKQSQKTTA